MNFALIGLVVLRAASAAELPLDSQISTSSEPLTTEKIWKIEASELNPHRRVWALERIVKLRELKGVAAPTKGPADFVLQSEGILAQTHIFVRAEGPWYSPLGKFSCQPQADDWFSTVEGAQAGAQVAADLWQKTLADRRGRLALELGRVRATSPDVAVARGYQAFQSWLAATEAEWRTRAMAAGRVAEWRTYLAAAKDLPACKDRLKKNAPVLAVPRREDLMEPPAKWDSEVRPRLLARLPAKRWNGLYSVRVSIDVGSQSLTGMFLVDSGAAMSVISPAWLETQGVTAEMIEARGLPPRKVHWSGGAAFAKVGRVFETRVGGLKTPLREFLLLDTEIFFPPESPGICCDGILGSDFLREYAVEFRTIEPYALEVWPRSGFNWGPDHVWIEATTLPSGDLISEGCRLERGKSVVRGVRWDTGSDSAIDLHRPYAALGTGNRDGWRVNCYPSNDLFLLAKNVQVSMPLRSEKASSGPFALSFPGFNIGMDLLGRGNFVFDLSHGRVWFDAKGLEREVPTNRTGLKLAYRAGRSDDRLLYVSSIAPGSRASALAKEGLKQGMIISGIDSVPAEELDLWRIDQRLAGNFGAEVILQWETPAGRKLVPLSVRGDAPKK